MARRNTLLHFALNHLSRRSCSAPRVQTAKPLEQPVLSFWQERACLAQILRFNASVKGTKMQAFARKEVIISGGVFNSPQFLKLSGIGPKSELEKFNITVIVDLPGVGSNLQD